MTSMDIGQVRSRYVAVNSSGAVLDQTDAVTADDDAVNWATWFETNDDGAADGYCLVALRRTVGRADEVIRRWGGMDQDIDLAALREEVIGP